MNNDLGCDVVRDLLPSYVDGLTSSATNKAVQAHLSGCAACTDALKRMKSPEDSPAAPEAEVDYLKKLRRRTRTTSLLIGIALMLLGMALLGYRYMYVGTRAQASDALYRVSVSGNTVTLSGTLTGSGSAVSRVTFSDSNGMVEARVYTVPLAFFNSGDFSASYTAASPVCQVRVADLIFWEEGTEISQTTARLFAASNPYVGDMPSNGRIADILGISSQFGAYTNELQTDSEPYGWTIKLEAPIADKDLSAARGIMEADSCAMLACIENLDHVVWEYESGGVVVSYSVSVVEASRIAGCDIKTCGGSASALQALMQSLSIRWSGVR